MGPALSRLPHLQRLVGVLPAGSFLDQLLAFEKAGHGVPLLDQLERRLGTLAAADWDLAKINTDGLLGGQRVSFFSGVAEIFGLAWLASRDLLRDVAVRIPKRECVKRKSPVLDALLGKQRGADVLADIKSVQAHVQGYVDQISDAVTLHLAAQGRGDLRLNPHVTGAPDVEHIRQNLAAITAAALAAVPEMLTGRARQIWNASEFRLRATLRKGRVQSGFSSVFGEILRLQKVLWKHCHQLSTKRPFLLVLVRTGGMGIDVGAMADLLGRALGGTRSEGRAEPIFGSRSRELVPKVGRTKAYLQRHLSGVLFLDEADECKASAKLYGNRYATHPLPRRFEAALR